MLRCFQCKRVAELHSIEIFKLLVADKFPYLTLSLTADPPFCVHWRSLSHGRGVPRPFGL